MICSPARWICLRTMSKSKSWFRPVPCVACRRDYYPSVMRECPVKPGNMVCMYCCGKCKRRAAAGTGWDCKAFVKGE
jgi:hypothetical protein